MGKKDIGLKSYLQNAVRYADLWNGAVFHGRQIVRAENLQEITPVRSKSDQEAVLERTGDLVMKQNYDGQRFVIFALENQEETDYGMPVRIMLQEALEYDRQIKEIRRKNKRLYQEMCERSGGGQQTAFYKDSGEYLYKVRREDYLYPVMTLVVYWGEREWRGPKNLHEMFHMDGMDSFMQEELKRMVPEYPLHFLNVSTFEHFEYFRTELSPLLELYQKRNCKEDFVRYIKTDKKCLDMDDESWYILSQMTDSKAIKSIIAQKNGEERSDRDMGSAIDDWLYEAKAEITAEIRAKVREEARAEARAEVREEVREEARAEIRAEERAIGKAEDILALLEEYGAVSEELKAKIMKQMDLQVLDEWFKLAVHTRNVDEFVQQSQIER